MSTHKAEEDPNGSPPAFSPALPLEIWTLIGEWVRSCISLRFRSIALVSQSQRCVAMRYYGTNFVLSIYPDVFYVLTFSLAVLRTIPSFNGHISIARLTIIS